MSKTFERRDWTLHEWQPVRLRLDEDLNIPPRRVSMVEEVVLLAALIGLGVVVVFLI